jgi:hypothetical protein
MKRARDFKEEIQEYNATVKKPKKTNISLSFDELCDYYDGIYVGSRFMGFVIPENPVMLLKKIEFITGKKLGIDEFIATDWSNNPKVFKHVILRISLYLQEYNKHFAITQRYEKTYGKDISTIRKQINKKYQETEIIKELVKGNTFNSIIPLYLDNKVIEPYEWGMEVINCVHDYFRYGDRKHVEMGNKERCMELLNGPMTEMGLVKKCKRFIHHPPIPTVIARSNNTFEFKTARNIYIPTMSFYDINHYDNMIKDLPVNCENVKFHELDNYATLDPDTTLVVPIGACRVFDEKFDVTSIYRFKKLPKTTKSVVLVFKNNGESKNYNLLDHVLFPGLKRTSALFRYIIPEKLIGKIVCYTTIKKFNSNP